MLRKSLVAVLMLAVVSLGFVPIASAQEVQSENPIRVAGTIINVDFPGHTFALRTGRGTDIHIHVAGATVFRSPNGAVGTFTDLERGMRVIVIGQETESGKIQAMTVGVSENSQYQTWIRLQGIIREVDAGNSSITLELKEEGRIQITGNDRTRFLSRDGTVQELSDLRVGMFAVVQAVLMEEGQLIAKVVAVGNPQDDSRERFNVSGEITNVIPGLNQFTVETREGRTVTFETSDRTSFRSRDGSITRIQDLMAGMFSTVVAVERESALAVALIVAIGPPPDRPEDRPEALRTAGRVTSISGNSFSIETREGDAKVFNVNNETQFRSHDGDIKGLGDVKTGIVVIVIAKEIDNQLIAILVGIGTAPTKQEGQIQPERPSQNPDLSGYNNT